MRVPPVLDRVMSPGEWDDARRMEGTFVIADGTQAEGEYPFRVWIGGDERNLYLAAIVRADRNPWSRLVEEDGGWGVGSVWYPDSLDVFLTMDLDGTLRPPADWKTFLNSREQGTRVHDGYWNGEEWTIQQSGPGGGHAFNDGRPEGGTWGRSGYTDDALFWEISIAREPVRQDVDGFHPRPGDAFRAAFAFIRQDDQVRDSSHEHPRDVYPGEGPTPDDFLDPSRWLVLRMDY